jgi:hypothetical protein
MKYHFASWKVGMAALTGALLVAVLFVASKPAASQNGGAAKCYGCATDGKTTPMKDGHPDLSGIWAGGAGGGGATTQKFERDKDGSILFDFDVEMGNEAGCYSDDCQAPNQPAYKPEYMSKVKAIAKTEFLGTTPLDPTKDCKPAGVPRAGIAGTMIQTPQAIIVLRGDYTDRVIYTDGSTHPADLETSYMGDSRGHWERYTREGDILTVETTVEDPVMLTKPWVLPARKAHIDSTVGVNFPQAYFCDGGGISALMRDHYVKPNPEDPDIKFKCAAHRCDSPDTKKDCNLPNKQNCAQ